MTEPATSAKPSVRDRLERIYVDFFAETTDGTPAGMFRILLGTLAVWQAIGIVWNLRRFWGHDGMIPWEIVDKDTFLWVTPFWWAPKSDALLYGQATLFALASVCLLVGFRPRIATLIVAWLHISFQTRNPFILNSGDRLFMIVAALAALMPLGHRFSVDAWLRDRAGKQAPPATLWGQRIIGMQIAYVYLNSAVAKLANKRWQNGMALRDVLASPVFSEWPQYLEPKALVWFMTYSALLFELSFPVCIWFKRYRPYVLLWGLAFHGGIDLLMIIPIFSAIMVVTYPAFLNDREAKWLLARLRSPRLLFQRTKRPAEDRAVSA